MGAKAVFVDRDGVINPLVQNPATGEYESPHATEDFSLYPFAVPALNALRAGGYLLFVVSNQPSYAKGKTSLENIEAIAQKLKNALAEHGDPIKRYYYCYHHPNGVVPELTTVCECRKPGTLFPRMAVAEYGLDEAACWFVGDRNSDVLCGAAMGFRTIKINNPTPQKPKAGEAVCAPDFTADTLEEASRIILAQPPYNPEFRHKKEDVPL